MKEVLDEILKKHRTIINENIRKVYKLDEHLEISVLHEGNKVVLWGFNHKTDRFLNLNTKRFKRLIDGFKEVSNTSWGNDDSTHILLDNLDKKEPVKTLSELDMLKETVHKLSLENEHLKNKINSLELELNKCLEIKNEHKVGRKKRFNKDQINQIKDMKNNGSSIREIARNFNCSIGLIHKLINEK